jgi:hypothetical protein
MAYPNQQPQQPTQPFVGQIPQSYQFQGPPPVQPTHPLPPEYQPQANPHADPYAPTTWGQFQDFTCPSGQRCALRPLDLNQLLAMGILEDINALTGIVETDVIRPAQGMPPLDSKRLLRDGKRVGQIMTLIDQIVTTVVARPALALATDEDGKKIPEADRIVGVVYVDSVVLGDRIAIFNESLKGVKDLESFRAAAAEPGGSVAGQQSGQLPSEPGVRNQ